MEVFVSISTFARLGKILVYALSSATITVPVKGISHFGSSFDNVAVALLSAIAGGLLQGAWKPVAFFAIPMLVADNIDFHVTRGGAGVSSAWA